MERRIALRPSAEADLDSIFAYISERNPGTAAAYIRRVRAYCDQLSYFSHRGTRRDDLIPGLRTLGFEGRITIAFRVLNGEVEILRILYGGRKLEDALSQI